MTLYGYSIGYETKEKSMTLFVRHIASDTIVDITTFDTSNMLMTPYEQYLDYCNYLNDGTEYDFLDTIGQLSPVTL